MSSTILPFTGGLLFDIDSTEFPGKMPGCGVMRFDDVTGVFVGIGLELSCAGAEGILVGTSLDMTGNGVIDISGVDGILLGSVGVGANDGDSVILGALVTVILQEAVAFGLSVEDAVIVTIPGLTAVTVPKLLTVAIDSSELFHIIDGSVASAGRMVGIRVRVSFICNAAVVLANVMELTGIFGIVNATNGILCSRAYACA